jgi:molecular chaperone DnaK (HSP70)
MTILLRIAYAILLFAACLPVRAETVVISPGSAVPPYGGYLAEAIGMEFPKGTFLTLLPRGCKLPCTKIDVFSTQEDQQPAVQVDLFRSAAGQLPGAHDLGRYTISGYPPQARKKPEIRIEVTATERQIRMEAFDNATGRALHIETLSPANAAPGVIPVPPGTLSASGAGVWDIGIQTVDGTFSPLMTGGCKAPCRAHEKFSTATDQQTFLKIILFRGSKKFVKAARKIGSCTVAGIAPAPRGEAAIAVQFTTDYKVVRVSAYNEKTKRNMAVKCGEE